jgi:hypothetical protein
MRKYLLHLNLATLVFLVTSVIGLAAMSEGPSTHVKSAPGHSSQTLMESRSKNFFAKLFQAPAEQRLRRVMRLAAPGEAKPASEPRIECGMRVIPADRRLIPASASVRSHQTRSPRSGRWCHRV